MQGLKGESPVSAQAHKIYVVHTWQAGVHAERGKLNNIIQSQYDP
jgi:hypothetical protein